MKARVSKRNDGAWIAATDEDKRKLDKCGIGEIGTIETINTRNYKLLQKYWVLIHFAFEHLPEQFDGSFAVAEDLSDELLIAIGWKRITKDFHGNEKVKAKSISYEKLPDDDIFSQVYERVLTLIARMIKIEEEDILNELTSFM